MDKGEELQLGDTKAVDSDQPTSLEEPPSKDEYPHGLRLVILISAVMMSVFLTSLDQTIVGTAIPKITNEFHGLEQVAWYGSAYFMCLGGFQSSWGKAFKYFSLKSTFIVSLIIFEIGSLICGLAPNSNALIVGRAIAGVGGAGVSTGGTVIFAFCVEPKRRPTLMGFIGFAYTIAAIFGPLLGGVFSDKVTWRWCFYINLPIGGVALGLIAIFFRTPTAAKVIEASWKEKILHLDPLGIVLAMGSIISFILALQYGGVTHPWNSSVVIGLLVGFVVILIVLGAWETYQGEYAMLPTRLFKKRSLWAGSAFQFFFAGVYFLLLYYLPIYFQSIKGGDAIQSGVDNLPLVIAGCLAVVAGGIVVTKTRHAMPFMVVGAVLATIASGLLYTLEINTASGKWIGYQIISGFALAFPFQNALNVAQADADSHDISTVTSSLYFFQVLGGAFSISAAQAAFVNTLISNLTANAPEVNLQLVIATGAAQLRSVFPADQIDSIIVAYMEGIKSSFAVAIGMVGFATLLSIFVPWQRLHGAPGDSMPVG